MLCYLWRSSKYQYYRLWLNVARNHHLLDSRPGLMWLARNHHLLDSRPAYLSLHHRHFFMVVSIPVNPPPFRVRALSPAWTGSHARETLISRTHHFLPHDLPPTKKSSTIKSWPTFCDQYFWKFPIWNSRADEKHREIRMVKGFKWYPVIDLFDTLQVNWVMEIN
jgi:hypothetical protein